MRNFIFTLITYIFALCFIAHITSFLQGHMKVTAETWEENVTHIFAKDYLNKEPDLGKQYYLKTSVSRNVQPTGFFNFETVYDTLKVSMHAKDVN